MRHDWLPALLILIVALCWPLPFAHGRDDGRYAASPLNRPFVFNLNSSATASRTDGCRTA